MNKKKRVRSWVLVALCQLTMLISSAPKVLADSYQEEMPLITSIDDATSAKKSVGKDELRATAHENRIVLIICSYNNKDWYRRNLDSVIAQNYHNYHIIYTNDASPDGTGDLVRAYIDEKGIANRITFFDNPERKGAMANQYRAITMCDDTDIIGILDGDDWLAHPNVLNYINAVYSTRPVWLTYGQFVEWPSGVPGFCHEMPAHIVANNAFRDYSGTPSHMRTFYAGLFKQIKIEDLHYNGAFVPMTCDMAAMIPMIEMARDHFAFIPDILYIYNAANVINDHRVSKDLQRTIDLYIRSKTRYAKVESPWPSKAYSLPS